MDRHEYLLGLVSVLVGLSIADLSLSFHRLLRARAQITWHWLTPVAAVLVLMLVIQFWWQFRVIGFVDQLWSWYWAFLVITGGLVAMFLLSAASLPDSVPDGGLSLEEYYFENASYFWMLFIVFFAFSLLMQLVPVAYVYITGGEVRLGVVLVSISGNIVVVGLLSSLCLLKSAFYHKLMVPGLLILLGLHWFQLKLS